MEKRDWWQQHPVPGSQQERTVQARERTAERLRAHAIRVHEQRQERAAHRARTLSRRRQDFVSPTRKRLLAAVSRVKQLAPVRHQAEAAAEQARQEAKDSTWAKDALGRTRLASVKKNALLDSLKHAVLHTQDTGPKTPGVVEGEKRLGRAAAGKHAFAAVVEMARASKRLEEQAALAGVGEMAAAAAAVVAESGIGSEAEQGQGEGGEEGEGDGCAEGGEVAPAPAQVPQVPQVQQAQQAQQAPPAKLAADTRRATDTEQTVQRTVAVAKAAWRGASSPPAQERERDIAAQSSTSGSVLGRSAGQLLVERARQLVEAEADTRARRARARARAEARQTRARQRVRALLRARAEQAEELRRGLAGGLLIHNGCSTPVPQVRRAHAWGGGRHEGPGAEPVEPQASRPQTAGGRPVKVQRGLCRASAQEQVQFWKDELRANPSSPLVHMPQPPLEMFHVVVAEKGGAAARQRALAHEERVELLEAGIRAARHK
jgi:hypothetical protein